MRGKSGTADREIARIASRAHGVLTRAQLLRAGITTKEIEERLGRGALIPQYLGVYRVGHRAPSTEVRYMAAVLACGPQALLCGRAAAHLYGLIKGAPPQPEVLTTTERRIDGILTRRTRVPEPRDATSWRGIPVTTAARTVVDLAAVLGEAALARACHEADVRHRVDPELVEAVLARRPNSPGSRKLRRTLRGEVHVTLSKLESRFLTRLRAAGLPLPETNRVATGRRVDCRWPAHRLTAELDSYRYHRTRHAWEQDRQREREARRRGDEFRRYTYADVFEDPAFMLTDLHSLLASEAA